MGKNYAGALKDIEMAMTASYLEGKRFKLYEGACKCRQAPSRAGSTTTPDVERDAHAEKAVLAYKKAMAGAPKSNLSKEKVAKFVKETNTKISGIKVNFKNAEKFR